jgi:hypothetical protein
MIDRLLDLLCWFSDRREDREVAAVDRAIEERFDVHLFEGQWIATEKPGWRERVYASRP